RALLLDKKNQSSAPAQSSTPAPVKAVKPNCVTCGGTHSYQNCPDTSENVYRDNMQEAYPHHGFFELHQLNTFYNALNVNDQDSLNSAAGGNFLDKMPQECLKIIESKSKVHQSRAKAVVPKVSTSSSTPAISSEVAELKDMDSLNSAAGGNFLDKMPQECLKIIESKSKVRQLRAKAVVSKVSTSSSTPAVSSEVTELKDLVRVLLLEKKNQSSAPAHSSTPAPVKAIETNCVLAVALTHTKIVLLPAKTFIETTSKSGNFNQGQIHRPQVNQPLAYQAPAYQAPIPQTQSVSIIDFESYIKANDAFLRNMQNQGQNLQIQMANLMDMLSKFVSSNTASSSGSRTLPSNTITNPKEDLKGLSLPKLNLTCMTLELADRSVSKPISVAKYVSVKTGRALIDVHKGKLTLRIENEAVTYNLDQTMRYSANYNQMMANKIDVICEMYSQEVLDFSDVTASGNFTPYDDPIVSTTLEDDPNSPKINTFYYDPEGDILLLKDILNSKPLPPIPNHEQYLPSFKKELKGCEAKTVKSSVDEPLEVKLKDLPPHLEYAFLEGDNKLPVIIAKELGDEEKSTLIKVLKSHKRAIA
nr:hypothetical protein [Tanacetum cinerariifolium]